MRKLIFILLLSSCMVSAQDFPVDSVTQRYCISRIVIAEDKSAHELYSMAKIWAIKTYNSPKSAIEVDEPDKGILMVKGAIRVNAKAFGIEEPFGYVHYRLTIDIKEGKYRYIITDFYFTPDECVGKNLEKKVFCLTEKQMKYIREQALNHVNALKNNLEISMILPKSDNW